MVRAMGQPDGRSNAISSLRADLFGAGRAGRLAAELRDELAN